jgi:hypothetical protein
MSLSMVITQNELLVSLNEIKRRTKTSIELSTRLIDRSFVQIKESYYNIYTVERSRALLNARLKEYGLL